MNTRFYIILLSCFTIKVQDDINSFICVCYLKIVRQIEVLNYTI